jgi:RNA polymerase sigma factor (sigma-70 family)
VKSNDVANSIDAPNRSLIEWQVVTRRIREGHEPSLTLYYETFFSVMFHEVQKVMDCDESTTLDLVQEAMLKAIRCMKVTSSQNGLSAWSRAVAKSVTYDWLRQRARHEKRMQVAADLRPADDSKPIENAARLQWLECELTQLPQELQKLFSLRYRLGWSLKKIAKNLGLKTGTVDGRLRRAIDRLKEKAQREYENE